MVGVRRGKAVGKTKGTPVQSVTRREVAPLELLIRGLSSVARPTSAFYFFRRIWRHLASTVPSRFYVAISAWRSLFPLDAPRLLLVADAFEVASLFLLCNGSSDALWCDSRLVTTLIAGFVEVLIVFFSSVVNASCNQTDSLILLTNIFISNGRQRFRNLYHFFHPIKKFKDTEKRIDAEAIFSAFHFCFGWQVMKLTYLFLHIVPIWNEHLGIRCTEAVLPH